MLRGRALPLCLAGAYVLLGVAWSISNAPFTAPDETAHYLRALGVADGKLIGPKAFYDDPTQTPEMRERARQLARSVRVPRGLSPVGFSCPVLRPVSAACQPRDPVAGPSRQVSSVGTYQPLPYLLPAAVVKLAGDAAEGDRLGRLAGLVAWALLVGAGALALWSPRRGALSLLGMVVALTPMTVFVGASLNGSGLEIAGAFGFGAAMLRLGRDEDPAAAWIWGLAGAAGAAVALSRTGAPLWAVAAVAGALALGGPGPLRRARKAHPRAAGIAAVAVVAGIAGNVAWDAAYGASTDFGLSPLRSSLGTGWRQLDDLLMQSVGDFGYLQVKLPAAAYVVWALLAAGLLGLALFVGSRRHRVTLIVAVAVCAAYPVLFYAAISRHAGVLVQGRHVLPLFVIAALMAGEVVYRRGDRLPPRFDAALLAALTVPAAAIQVVAWWVNSRRWAVGPGGRDWFVGSADWSPPVGWGVWLALVALAALALALAPVVARRVRSA